VSRIETIARGLWRQGDRVLLCRDLAHGHAYLPGGHVETGETAAEAVRREIEEECGAHVTVGPPLLCWEAMFKQRGVRKHEITLVFHVEHTGGGPDPDQIVSLEDHIAFEWAAAAELPAAGVLPPEVAEWAARRAAGDRSLDWLSLVQVD